MIAGAWGMAKGMVSWVRWEIRESAENFMRDIRSMRALWNWLFMALYVWENVWGILFHPAVCLNTCIVTTGGVVMAIFTNYVWSGYLEKKGANGNGVVAPPMPKMHPREKDGKDDSDGSA